LVRRINETFVTPIDGADILRDPMVVIRWKDIFERLEDAIDATERHGLGCSRPSSSRTPE
jgi:hypothetical protein